MSAAQERKTTYAEYLEAEERAVERHDFLRGEVYAMSGGTLEHSALSGAFAYIARTQLAGKRCVVFESNAKVRNRERDFSAYPDVSIVCGTLERPGDDDKAIANPVLVCEVLSDSTEAYDRGTKSTEYRHISSIQEIVLIMQNPRRVEVQRRNAAGIFEISTFEGDTVVRLTSVQIELPLAVLYADVERIASMSG
jgi:Uma2 family endonuclease